MLQNALLVRFQIILQLPYEISNVTKNRFANGSSLTSAAWLKKRAALLPRNRRHHPRMHKADLRNRVQDDEPNDKAANSVPDLRGGFCRGQKVPPGRLGKSLQCNNAIAFSSHGTPVVLYATAVIRKKLKLERLESN